jgi:hypothetical protein
MKPNWIGSLPPSVSRPLCGVVLAVACIGGGLELAKQAFGLDVPPLKQTAVPIAATGLFVGIWFSTEKNPSEEFVSSEEAAAAPPSPTGSPDENTRAIDLYVGWANTLPEDRAVQAIDRLAQVAAMREEIKKQPLPQQTRLYGEMPWQTVDRFVVPQQAELPPASAPAITSPVREEKINEPVNRSSAAAPTSPQSFRLEEPCGAASNGSTPASSAQKFEAVFNSDTWADESIPV